MTVKDVHLPPTSVVGLLKLGEGRSVGRVGLPPDRAHDSISQPETLSFLFHVNSSCYPDADRPKYLSNIGGIEASGNSCGSNSFLIWMPLSETTLKTPITKITKRFSPFMVCLRSNVHVCAHIEINVVTPVQDVCLEVWWVGPLLDEGGG